MLNYTESRITHMFESMRLKSRKTNICSQSLEWTLAWIFWPAARSTSKSIQATQANQCTL